MSGRRTRLWAAAIVVGVAASSSWSSDLLGSLLDAPPSEARERWNRDGATWIASSVPFNAKTRSALTSSIGELARSNPPLHATVLSDLLSVTDGTPDHRFALTLRLLASPVSERVAPGPGFWPQVERGLALAQTELYADPVFGLPAAVRAGDSRALAQWIDAAATGSDANPSLVGRARLIAMLRDPGIAPLAALDELRRGGLLGGLSADDAAAVVAGMIRSGSISPAEREEAFELIAPSFTAATLGARSMAAISASVRGAPPEHLGEVIATLSDVIACVPALGSIRELNRMRSAAVFRVGDPDQIRAAAWVQSVLESSSPGPGAVQAWRFCDVDPGVRGEAWGLAPKGAADPYLRNAFERAASRDGGASDGTAWQAILTQQPLVRASPTAQSGSMRAIEMTAKSGSLLAYPEALLAELTASPLASGADAGEDWHAGRNTVLLRELDRTVRVVSAWAWNTDRPMIRDRLLALALGLVPTASGYDAERVEMVDAVLSLADRVDVNDPIDVLLDASDHPSIDAELLYRQSTRAVETGAFERASLLAQRAAEAASRTGSWDEEKHAASRLVAAVAELQRREYADAEKLLARVSADPLAGPDQLSQAAFLMGWLGLARNDVSGARLWLASAIDLHGGAFASSSLELVRRLEQNQIRR